MIERFNMVDMGGIDLLESNGSVVPGIYQRITEAVNSCGDAIFYNWLFAGIPIPPYPQHVLTGDPIMINGVIEVTSTDQITVHGINPATVVLVALVANQNRTYLPSEYEADGFSSVVVDVEAEPTTLVPLLATENKIYNPSDYNADGFSSVEVNVPPQELYVLTVSISGGYNGGAVLTVSHDNVELFRATGSSPYNTSYTPDSYSGIISNYELEISVPQLQSNTSPLQVNVSLDGISKVASFTHTGSNTSYGYGDQSANLNFAI